MIYLICKVCGTKISFLKSLDAVHDIKIKSGRVSDNISCPCCNRILIQRKPKPELNLDRLPKYKNPYKNLKRGRYKKKPAEDLPIIQEASK